MYYNVYVTKEAIDKLPRLDRDKLSPGKLYYNFPGYGVVELGNLYTLTTVDRVSLQILHGWLDCVVRNGLTDIDIRWRIVYARRSQEQL